MVAIISVAEHVILSHSPGVDLIRSLHNSIVVVSSCGDMDALLLALSSIITFNKFQFPKLVNKLWPIEVENVLKIILLV